MTDASRSMPNTPYCGFNHNLGYYSFDTTGKKKGIYGCDYEDYFSCLCKKGACARQTIHTRTLRIYLHC